MDEGIYGRSSEGIPENDGPGVHIMKGPILSRDAKGRRRSRMRYLQMIPRLKFGSKLDANWGYLYQGVGETEGGQGSTSSTANSQQASALFRL